MAVDWSDPCARYAALRDAYYANLSGSGETLIRYKGPEGEREVRYKATDLNRLLAEMRSAQTECQIATGAPRSGRYAIRAGAPTKGPL
jgi:hypothetical protein